MESSVLDLLSRHGRNATSFQALEPGIDHWMSADGEACVAYTDTGRAWVALGEPLAATERIHQTVDEFVAAAADSGRRARFFALEEELPPSSEMTSLVIGEQPEWTVARWREQLASKRSLREQLRRARAKGVSVQQVDGIELAASDDQRAELEALAHAWKATKSMAPMRFAVTLDLFGNAGERRYFLARHDGALVGALIAVPIYARSGWLIEDLLRAPEAPNGTTELLFDAATRAIAEDGAEVLTMGMAPLSAVDSRLLRAVRATTPWLFDWNGLRAFKAKLLPNRWAPVYAAYPKKETGLSAIIDVLRCFAGGSLLSFAARTLLHRYRAVLWLFAAMLIPWTAAMSTGAATRYFPSLEAQAGWITFDVALFVGLVALAIHFTRPLAQLLAIGTALDLIVGIAQAVGWNASRAAGIDWLVIFVALVAPAIAAIFLTCLSWRGQSSPVAEPVAT